MGEYHFKYYHVSSAVKAAELLRIEVTDDKTVDSHTKRSSSSHGCASFVGCRPTQRVFVFLIGLVINNKKKRGG